MHLVDMFTLETHTGPYEKWPRRTRLFAHGADTGQTAPGYVIEAQYKCAAGYLLITSYDCVFEEANTFSLLNDRFETTASTTLGVMYDTYLLEKHRPVSENTLEFDYGGGEVYCLTIKTNFLGQPKLMLVPV
jgi:hypothetical protein